MSAGLKGKSERPEVRLGVVIGSGAPGTQPEDADHLSMVIDESDNADRRDTVNLQNLSSRLFNSPKIVKNFL